MRIFSVPEAKYFCQSYSGGGLKLVGDIVSNAAVRTFKETSPEFTELRDALLREAEQNLFLSVSHYRRTLDLMMASAAGWAHVSLYYGAFAAARALLGMFGAWTNGRKMMVEVKHQTPGSQALELTATKTRTNYTGSHEKTWDLFYQGVSTLHPWIDARLLIALRPVSGNAAWQAKRRNEINYQSNVAVELSKNFEESFNRSKFPTSLPPPLVTQYKIFEALLEIVVYYAGEFRLETDALDQLGGHESLYNRLKTMVFEAKAPGLVRKSKKRKLLLSLR